MMAKLESDKLTAAYNTVVENCQKKECASESQSFINNLLDVKETLECNGSRLHNLIIQGRDRENASASTHCDVKMLTPAKDVFRPSGLLLQTTNWSWVEKG